MYQARTLAAAVFTLGLIFLTTACGSSNANIRLLNAMLSQTSLDLLVDGKTVSTGVAYASGSSYASTSSGSHHLQAEATGTTTIFFETLVSPKVAETLAREIGARSAVLDPLEGLTQPGSDYFTVMRANLAALTLALGCDS